MLVLPVLEPPLPYEEYYVGSVDHVGEVEE